MCRCAVTPTVGEKLERLATLLKLGAQGFGRLNNIGLVFLGVLAKGLDKGNQDLIHIRGKILRLFFTGGAGSGALGTGK